MQVTFGKHAGKSVELLMIKEPSYIKWVLGLQSPTGAMAMAKTHIKQLIHVFDVKPFVGKACWAITCKKPATKFTVYLDNLDLCWWCSTCNPYQTGADGVKLQSPISWHFSMLSYFVGIENRIAMTSLK